MNKQDIKELIQQFDQSDLTDFVLKNKDVELKFAKIVTTVDREDMQSKRDVPISSISDNNKPQQNEKLVEVRSPMVGTFYSSDKQDGKPFVQVGDLVQEGQVLCIIEAMKTMNEIVSPVEGKVISIVPSNGEFIDYDKVIIVLE
ncbi:MAG TPA: hypothetical protein GXZ43_05425 [Clostridiaceae bacterium]|nr:hypothetical protein [Clostridiaceae bacterium]